MRRTVLHVTRSGHGLTRRATFHDVGAHHGATMDAPDWLPHGATKRVQMIPATPSEYDLITGHNSSRSGIRVFA